MGGVISSTIARMPANCRPSRSTRGKARAQPARPPGSGGQASAATAMSTMEWSGILYVVLPLAAALVLVLIMYPAKPKAREAPRPVWHYLLLWPLIVDMGARQANPGRIARTFKVIGRVIVAALMIVAMVFAG